MPEEYGILVGVDGSTSVRAGSWHAASRSRLSGSWKFSSKVEMLIPDSRSRHTSSRSYRAGM